ncbi:hypothetical protein [Leptospira noguchii]|uniref:hypothetical protein n=1 Tax=Leptospira noguchii TaxID=28182 RepID=UPI001FB5BAD0|nr:hypothetical protein [Leptospira noguchii]UOG51022.1 hypothetical protein MAL00_20290 [Leptospira noguchii]
MFHRPGMKSIESSIVFTIVNKYLNAELFYTSLIFHLQFMNWIARLLTILRIQY